VGDDVIGVLKNFILELPHNTKATTAILKASVLVQEIRKLQKEGVI